MESNANIKKIQKRNRVPLACSNCRRKKTKCDRRKPTCQVCEAHGLTDCQYFQENIDLGTVNIGTFTAITKEKGTSADTADIKKLTDKIEKLERMLSEQTTVKPPYQPLTISAKHKLDKFNINLETSGEYLINIRQLFVSLKINGFDQIQIYQDLDSQLSQYTILGIFGPFAWATIIMKDPFTTPLWKTVIEEQNTIKSTFKKPSFPVKSKLVSFNKDIDRVFNTTNVEPFSAKSEQLSLIEKILKIIPTKKAIWLFIARFFKYVYPFLPYLDEADFIADVERIIGGNHITDLTKDIKVKKLKLQQHTDLAVVGSLLTVIVFAYESLLENTGNFVIDENTTDVERYLIKYECPDMLIGCAELCMNEYKLLKRCALPVLQCAILLREYQKVDGCDCFADGDSHIYTGLLIQMATTLGLNRDPAFTDNITAYSKKSLLLRKIWYGLVSADNYQYMQTGTPPLIYPNYYDTKLPWFDETTTNIEDKELERVTINMMREKYKIESRMRKVADLAANMLQRPTIEEILLAIFELKISLNEQFGSLNNILTSDHMNIHHRKVEKVLSMMIYMHSLTLLQPVMLHIYYHYQSLRNFDATVFFYNKILSFWMYIIANLEDLVKSSNKFFGSGFDLFLVPLIEVAMHKGLIFFTSSYVKVSIVQKKILSLSDDHSELIDVMECYKKNILQKLFSDVYIPLLTRLSKKYFYCWRMLKAHSCIFRNLNEDKLDYSAQFSLFNFMEFFSAADFRILIKTSTWKYYKAGEEQAPWLADWLKNYYQCVYYIPGDEPLPMSKNFNVTDSTISDHTPVDRDGLINDLAYVDEKWLNKIYEKVFMNKNPYGDLNVDNSILTDTPSDLGSEYSMDKEMKEIDNLMLANNASGVSSIEANLNDIFWIT